MKRFLKTLGPGILFASTAIGVSHLVQSTQAGANFGFTLIWAILLANLFKYPFFQYGSRYANATGTSIIEGYAKLGKLALGSFFIITFISMFLVTSAVAFVTAGFMQNLFGIENGLIPVVLLIIICLAFLISGRYNVLDGLTKVIGIVLLLSTLTAFTLVLIKGKQGQMDLWSFDNTTANLYWLFIIPLMGWMPTAVDLSAWNSLWTLERIKQTGFKPTLKETIFEFNFGYWISALLAICFVTLGAYTMFGTGKEFSPQAGVFSGQVVQLYTDTFGNWSYLIIAASAFSIMFGTSIAVYDGYSRSMQATLLQVLPKKSDALSRPSTYKILLVFIALGSFLIIYFFQGHPKGFKKIIDLSTSVSFVFAPIVGYFNLRLVTAKYIGAENVPDRLTRYLSYGGLAFLIVFSIFFLFQDYFIPFLL